MIYLKTTVGVEIRGDDLLLAALQSNFSRGVFTAFKRIKDFRQREKEEVRKEVDSFFRSNRLNRDSIVLGIPRKHIIIRHLDLPGEIVDNLKQVMLYQVQTYAPTEEDTFSYDYTILESMNAGKRLAVLLIMMKRSILDEYLKCTADLGMRPVAVMGSSIGLANLFLRDRKDLANKTFFLADLTAAGIEILAIRDGKLVYSRESAKSADASWRQFLLEEINNAAGKIRMAQEDSIEKVLLSGEMAGPIRDEVAQELPDLESLSENIGVLVPPDNVSVVQEAVASLGLAYSASVRKPAFGLNLLPTELRVQQSRFAYISAAVLCLIAIALVITLGFRQVVQDRMLITKLDGEIESLKVPVNRVMAIRSDSEALEKRVAFIEGLLNKRDMNLEILQELTTTLPQDTFLNVYNNKEGTIQLAGSSSSAPDLIPKLEKSPLIKDVVQRGTIFKDAQTGKDRFNFEATLER